MTESSTRKGIAGFSAHRSRTFSYREQVAKKLVLKTLKKLRHGCLRIHEHDDCYTFGERPQSAELVADIHVHDPAAYADVAFSGSVGSGEAYMSGYWSTPNLTSVVRIFVRNMDALDAMDQGQSRLSKMILRLFAYFKRNSKEGARRNISAHYDLGNDFFSLFLDEKLMYSSAIFPDASASLEQAAEHKLHTICEKLELKPSDHLLEIGTGWGGMAIYAAQHYGCKVTTTTISAEQYEYAKQKVAALGLNDKITLLFDDYRDLQGQYDKLVSVEMIEAVGYEHYPKYFEVCSGLIKDDGLMLLQAITIADQRYEMAKNSVDFIQRYIFPGGGLPSVSKVLALMGDVTKLNLLSFEDIGLDYAKTLKCWRERFLQQLPQVREQGFDDRFIRLWEYYLCYCEGGFVERSIGTGQFLFAGPDYRHG
ncbi:cyclopropane-fatty-acyl-phospholipid synthase family protein [Gilvimarinus sp. DA14]|uniref:SAM-dependent methyltransferase n=1 Tax=Gilvimarinus sp. DA14 TaxID=2956798 RepID=UPI0020B86DC0|nr:cyclopropane-fatty-acyl-phospholipid synthase family protein [Gilvimarinus sp. DA14]UTF60703.1 cyclopropane-fatty-acyl-phospholipid synthase family protein [Gilvimarinus sp. DA14]